MGGRSLRLPTGAVSLRRFPMDDRIFVTLMGLVPRSALSRAVGALTRLPAPPALHQAAMRAFARSYRVDMAEAELSFEGYRRFSDFFSRGLKPGARAVDADPAAVVSPVDGTVSEAGQVEAGSCLQAKGIRYPVDRLLGDADLARAFTDGGSFATLYLSPRDYHRVHAPVGGGVVASRYLRGEFWPVNPATVRTKEALFCANERLVTLLEGPLGRCAVVKVGATCVGRIRSAYDDRLTHAGQLEGVRTYQPPLPVAKGDELGRFEMGSTVILLFEPGRVRWESWLRAGAAVRMGQRIGGAG
jgi:phosphatidylserine decarboxylase